MAPGSTEIAPRATVSALARPRELAAGTPGARMLVLQGRNHVFFDHEPEAERFFEEVDLFLGD